MTILNLGISGRSPYTSSSSGYRVYEAEDGLVGPEGHDVRLVWSTEYGSDTQKTFHFTIAWRAWERGRSIRTPWSDPISATVSPSECNERVPHEGGRVWWSHDLDLGNLLSQIADSNGAFRYDTRLYDSIDLSVSLYSRWLHPDGTTRTSPTASGTVYVGHIPAYRITSVYYEESDLLVVEYDTSWERQDDRYCFEPDCRVASWSEYPDEELELLSPSTAGRLFRGNTWGTVAAPGRIEVPTSALTQHVKRKRIWLDVRFNAAYRPIDMDFAGAAGWFTVEDRTVCNTPTLAVAPWSDPYSVRLKTGDEGDLGAPIEKVTVKMVGGKYAADEVTVEPGEYAVMWFCPFGEPLTFEAVGSRGKATSDVATVSTPALDVKGVAMLESIDADPRALLQWNQQYSITTSGDYDVVKLAGRRRPSAFYGSGGTTAVQAQCVVIDETGADVERMPEFGDVMLRLGDGRRYALAMEATVSWDGPRVKTVAISGEEVDA